MPIPLKCPCGRTTNAPEKLAGKSARCMYCGRSLAVPAADEAPYELLPEELLPSRPWRSSLPPVPRAAARGGRIGR